jgi:hypothetical protein
MIITTYRGINGVNTVSLLGQAPIYVDNAPGTHPPPLPVVTMQPGQLVSKTVNLPTAIMTAPAPTSTPTTTVLPTPTTTTTALPTPTTSAPPTVVPVPVPTSLPLPVTAPATCATCTPVYKSPWFWIATVGSGVVGFTVASMIAGHRSPR